ncbi:MAG: oligosaccharide flippase family protein, partial [Lachnospiraceae bacterium]|nr:oligosaccharide flippase family protein [Lachnospiraceae bacterium]
MTKGSLFRALISFSVPLILSGLLQQLYSWADAFIVGNVEGETALAAIGATGMIVNLFISVINGFTSGISILAAQRFESGNVEIQKKILYSFIIILGTVFLGLSMCGVFFA